MYSNNSTEKLIEKLNQEKKFLIEVYYEDSVKLDEINNMIKKLKGDIKNA